MCESGDSQDEANRGKSQTEKDREHDQRNRSQLELLKLAYQRKRHRDHIDELRRRVADAKNAGGDDS
jgi:hypothetical protein